MAWVGKQLWELGRDTSVGYIEVYMAYEQHGYAGYMFWESKFLFLGSGCVRT